LAKKIIQIQLLDEATGAVLETVVPETEGRAVLVQSGSSTVDLQTYLNSLVLQKGDKGDKGDTGAQGPKGDKGDTGTAGTTGAKGDKGDTGSAGAKGDKGDAGSKMHNVTAAPAGTLGVVGDWALNTTTGDVYEKTATSTWTTRGNFKGLKGDTGSQGLNGDKGDTGSQGLQGLKGDTGAQGAQGAKGDKGDTGTQGIQGAKGDKGDTGTTGAAGAKGDPGSIMYNVTAAPAGTLGLIGDWALNTTNGDVYEKTAAAVWTKRGNFKGATGSQGVKGDKGDPGDGVRYGTDYQSGQSVKMFFKVQ